jgi:zinc protease
MPRFSVRSLLLTIAFLFVITAMHELTRFSGARTLEAAAQAKPPASALLPFQATERTLPNGLKVIVVPTGFPNLVSLQIPVQTGARNEVEAGKSGFAHFFEHMMFRGTKRFPPDAYQGIVTRAGASQNAYTSQDYTNYHMTFAKEDLPQMLEIEADRFQNLSYDEAAFKTEARAVLGEYNKNSANPLEKLIEVQQEQAFTTHTYKHTTIGFIKDIEDMPNQFEYSKSFFSRWYRPEYTTIIVAGDVTPAEVLPLVEKYWGSWKSGTYKAEIPQEPPSKGPVKAHVDWPSDTLPWITIAFHGPAFSDTGTDYVALDMLMDLSFGSTSALYKRLVVDEQKVDQLGVYYPASVDPFLATIYARLKKPEDAPYVRDAILRTFAEARSTEMPAQRLEDAKGNTRYSLLRSLDNTQSIAALLAQYVRFHRSFDTLNNLFNVYSTLTPAILKTTAQKYLTNDRLVQTTLSSSALPAAIDTIPSLDSLSSSTAAAVSLAPIVQKTPLPQLDIKLMFKAGSAYDPKGKEGLAQLAASMIAEAGSQSMRIDEIQKALYPIAGSFSAQVDKEVTVFTARIHRDNLGTFSPIAWPMLTEPGFRAEDFDRLKAAQRNALVEDLRGNNEEELGKEQLQHDLFAGTPYAHPVLGTLTGIDAITLEDVKAFVKQAYTRAALHVGLSGDIPQGLEASLGRELAKLPAGPAMPEPTGVVAKKPKGISVDIIEKETRATAISFGHPIEVTRSHPDFPALTVARSWLGEHRSSSSHLYQQIRELRGMNYGDYAYIEAFPRGMFEMKPEPNVVRRAQLFEIWIRPVVPENGHMALRIALFELRKLIEKGMSKEEFETTRNYLMKSAFLLTATQDSQLGYALDSKFYGIPEFTPYIREQLVKLTVDDVNRAIRKHLSGNDLHVVIITKDAAGLKQRLLSDAVSTVTYDAPKPKEVTDEDAVIGAMKLNIAPDALVITKVEDVFKN